jgi:hypothetical protein
MHRRSIRWGLLILLLLVGGQPSLAQDGGGTCPALVAQALDQVAAVCDDVARNEACYGSTQVAATFTRPIDDAFNAPADRVPVDVIERLQTAPLDEAAGVWGVAVLTIQADLPDSLPGQAVKFILYGDVELENAGGSQPSVADRCPATTTTASNIRSGPGTTYNVMTSLPAEAPLQIRARSTDGTWLYTVANGQPGWISGLLVTLDCAAESLPVREADVPLDYGPMQAFYFTTGFGGATCQEMPPSSLVVESPEGYAVSLNANGVDVTISSTVAFTAPAGQPMTISTLDGQAIVRAMNQTQLVPAGLSTTIPLVEAAGEAGGGFLPAGPPTGLAVIDPDAWGALEAMPALFDEPLILPAVEDWASVGDFCDDPANRAFCSDPIFDRAVCGDGVCDPAETALTCPADCAAPGADGPLDGGGLLDGSLPGVDDILDGDGLLDGLGDDLPGTCGDGLCGPLEDSALCPADCVDAGAGGGGSLLCGNGICGPLENTDNCPADCPAGSVCGNALCEPGENLLNCPADCP